GLRRVVVSSASASPRVLPLPVPRCHPAFVGTLIHDSVVHKPSEHNLSADAVERRKSLYFVVGAAKSVKAGFEVVIGHQELGGKAVACNLGASVGGRQRAEVGGTLLGHAASGVEQVAELMKQ